MPEGTENVPEPRNGEHPSPPRVGRSGGEGLVLAFDFGTQRIGVAIGENLLGNARALTTIDAAANDARFSAIGRLIDEWQPVRLVVGLPLSLDGTAHEMTARSRRFANQLAGRFHLPVELVDERLSSAEAETRLRSAGRGGRAGKAAIDAEAARIILQDWFEHAPAA